VPDLLVTGEGHDWVFANPKDRVVALTSGLWKRINQWWDSGCDDTDFDRW
jgi:hypothetical protein